MDSHAVFNIIQDMSELLSITELQALQKSLLKHLTGPPTEEKHKGNEEYVELFLSAKRVEGLSKITVKHYKEGIMRFIEADPNRKVLKVTTEEIRLYLMDHQDKSKCSNATLDTERRYLSSFYAWLNEEDYILKNPMLRIHKIKSTKKVKEAYTDEDLESMRDACDNIRDRAIIDMLNATGMRVSELVQLNIRDIDFEKRECKVLGKGDKERMTYFDAKTKLHLQQYLEQRTDDNEALFVGLIKPYERIGISAVERRVRKIGRNLNIKKCHPHKFRTTCATRAIDKGMPVEQVQKLLGHTDISTTMTYALVNQENVKISHRKFIQ